jgi:hypothetical protein
MIETLRTIITGAVDRLSLQMRDDLPPLIAAAAILGIAYVMARGARWFALRAFKGIQVDHWLRRSGVASVLNRSGTLRASRIVAQTVYWTVLIVGALTALNAFGTDITARMVEGAVLMLPRILLGGLIMFSGLWLGQYLGRSMLVWAVNEDFPSPRRLAMLVRVLVVFVAVVVTADTLNFAREVFLAAFILLMGGAALAGGLAIGLGARDAVRRHLEERAEERAAAASENGGERSVWSHL